MVHTCKCPCFVSLQRWARAFRDNDYHCAVDTNNGVEAQNKLFKYTFLPRNKQKATLSTTITILVNDYLPSCKQKYLFQNYRQLSEYRAYKDSVPLYLHNRPRSVIIHCLDRKTKGERFPVQSVCDMDGTTGVFEVQSESGSKKTVNFGHHSNMPTCTCKDWQRFHLPCKHFFAVFQHRANWQWEQLPQSYLQSAYLSTDSDALAKHFSTEALPAPAQQFHSSEKVTTSDNPDILSTEGTHEQQVQNPGEEMIPNDPPKQVTIMIYMYL